MKSIVCLISGLALMGCASARINSQYDSLKEQNENNYQKRLLQIENEANEIRTNSSGYIILDKDLNASACSSKKCIIELDKTWYARLKLKYGDPTTEFNTLMAAYPKEMEEKLTQLGLKAEANLKINHNEIISKYLGGEEEVKQILEEKINAAVNLEKSKANSIYSNNQTIIERNRYVDLQIASIRQQQFTQSLQMLSMQNQLPPSQPIQIPSRSNNYLGQSH